MQRLAPKPGERILDLGCGTARLSTILLETMGEGHVVGLDRSEAMLREAAGLTTTRPPITPLHDASTDPSRLSFVQADTADNSLAERLGNGRLFAIVMDAMNLPEGPGETKATYRRRWLGVSQSRQMTLRHPLVLQPHLDADGGAGR